MSKRGVLLAAIVAGGAALFALGWLLIVGIPMDQDAFRRRVTEDAVLVISGSVGDAVRAGRPSSEIDALIAELIHASVIHGAFDRNAKPTDIYKTPFRVTANGRAVTATSAGPDRIFDTSDDIAHTTTPP